MRMLIKSSYAEDDVKFLLSDLTGELKLISTKEWNDRIANGEHYSTMLNKEDPVSDEYLDMFHNALTSNAKVIATRIAFLGEMLLNKAVGEPVLISLVRAGTPIGILLKRYIESQGRSCKHYSISIIRDVGIDYNAMRYIYEENGHWCHDFFFVDGWTGKGVIQKELTKAVNNMKAISDDWKNLSSALWVVSDPANVTPYCATRNDCLIPSAMLNSTVSGMVSRSVLNDMIGPEDFHGAVICYGETDVSRLFVDYISKYFDTIQINKEEVKPHPLYTDFDSDCVVQHIMHKFGVNSVNKVKPGIGEATRVLLRRNPKAVILRVPEDFPDVVHLVQMCREKNVPILHSNGLGYYYACSIIQ